MGAGVSDFFTINPNLKYFLRGGGEGDGGGVDGRTDEQAQTNLSLKFLRRWGHNNA